MNASTSMRLNIPITIMTSTTSPPPYTETAQHTPNPPSPDSLLPPNPKLSAKHTQLTSLRSQLEPLRLQLRNELHTQSDELYVQRTEEYLQRKDEYLQLEEEYLRLLEGWARQGREYVRLDREEVVMERGYLGLFVRGLEMDGTYAVGELSGESGRWRRSAVKEVQGDG
ncbi:hypothetical protein VF21_02431 [Pseudogymnoascus sp. 05NY08]|nr:hypothetical protein VF21_02431 [Pseudogymnoascus sp. 05NY08]